MGAFRDSIRQAIDQVFGHADIQDAMRDDFDFCESFPEHKRKDFFKPPQPAIATTKPMKRTPRPTPRPTLDPLPRPPVNLAQLPKAALEASSSLHDPDPAAALPVTVGAPHAAESLELEAEFDSLFEAAAWQPPEDEEAPPNRDTLDITMRSTELPAAEISVVLSPSEPDRVLGSAERMAPAEPEPVWLEQPEPEEPEPPKPLRLTAVAPLIEHESTSLAGLAVNLGGPHTGVPPSSIWDEAVIKEELLDDLAQAYASTEEPGERRVIDALRRSIADEKLEFPPFPPAAAKLVGSGGGPPADEEILEVVKTDPALAGNVVKVANSPFYMAAVPVASLNAAVVRIGLDQVRRVSLAATVGGSFQVKGYESLMAHMRLHSVATAMAAELMAVGSQVNAAEAFLAGLLHDVGEALAVRLVKRQVDLDTADGDDWFPDRRVLRNLASRHHLRLGALFLGTWDLAASVASSLAYHHHPELAEPRFADLARLIHVADALAQRALEHVRSVPWREHLSMRDGASNATELSAAVAHDGIDQLMVEDLLERCGKRWDAERLRGVLRSVALRLDSDDVAALDNSATLASMTY